VEQKLIFTIINRPSHLKIFLSDRPKMACATLSRWAMCGNVAAKRSDACLQFGALTGATYGLYIPLLDGPFRRVQMRRPNHQVNKTRFNLYASSSRAMGSAPVGVRCQFHQLPPTSSVQRHLTQFLKRVFACYSLMPAHLKISSP